MRSGWSKPAPARAAGALLLLLAGGAARATPPRPVGFIESARVLVGNRPVALAIGDLDGDGHPDAVVANEDSTLRTLRGDGAGGLGAPQVIFNGTDLAGVALADLDHDGILDIAVSSPASGTVFTLFGVAGGTFARIRALTGPWSPRALAVLEPGAGAPDLVAADVFFASIVQVTNAGDGTLGFGGQLAGFVDPVAIAVGDEVHNGNHDVAVADAASHAATLVTHLGFSAQARHDQPLAGRPTAVGMGDLDRDGHDDVVLATRSPGEIATCLGAPDGSLGPAHAVPSDPTPVALVLGDLDGDGRLDAAVADHDFASLAVWLGRGDGTFVRLGGIPIGPGPAALAIADMNGDGWPDLVCANHDDGTLQVLLNTSTLAAGTIHLFAPSPNPASTTSLITFALSTPTSVRLDVHDISGRLVRRLVDGTVMPVGPHTVSWDGRTDAGDRARSGMYMVRLRAGGADVMTKLVLGR